MSLTCPWYGDPITDICTLGIYNKRRLDKPNRGREFCRRETGGKM